MICESFYQLRMNADNPEHLGLAWGSFEWRLREELPRIVSVRDFEDWYSSSMGAPCSCPMVLTGMLLLQSRFNLTDEQIVERARRDRGFRFALRLDDPRAPTPSVTTLRRFRARLRTEKGGDFLHKRVLELAVAKDLIPDVQLQAQDSSNTNCRGAQLDTFNLIAAAIRLVIGDIARARNRPARAIAEEWKMCRYLPRSIKGQVSIDWTADEERNKLLTEEISDADRVLALVSELGMTTELPPSVHVSTALLRQVARQDVEQLDDGTYRIKRGVAKGRIVSISDPEARHGRKSSSKVILGFKHHVQGTLASLFVTGIVITDASVHDSQPSPDLIDQSAEVGLKPEEVVADLAYGTGRNIRSCDAKGVAILSKQSKSSSTDCLTKEEFDIDLVGMTATCPGGQTTAEHSMVKAEKGTDERVPCFKFQKEVCRQCPLAGRCNSETRKGKRRTLELSIYEAELQRKKAFNATPRAKAVLRSRSAIERLISHLIRMGMRKARFFGIEMVQFQAYLAAAAYNLQRVFTLSAESEG